MSSQPGDFNSTTGQEFLDDDFGADVTVSLDQFLDSPAKAAAPLFADLKFGFDL